MILQAVYCLVLLVTVISVIGLRFLTGPLGLPGLEGVILIPVLMSILLWVSKILLKQVAMVLLNEFELYFRGSPGISYGPVALLLLKFFCLDDKTMISTSGVVLRCFISSHRHTVLSAASLVYFFLLHSNFLARLVLRNVTG